MTPDRLREIIAAYGAEVSRWPPEEREAARSLISRSPELNDEVARMAGLDRVLDRWPAPAPALDATALAARITATPQRRPDVRNVRRFGWPLWAWPNAAGLAAAALAGFLIGWSDLGSTVLPTGQSESIDGQIVASVIEDATW